MADCHIGGWRDPKLKELTIQYFERAIDICIEKNVAFVIIAGDLFNTSVPSIDLISRTSSILTKLKDNDIEVYIVPGSHDFSPSGKTMLDVLEKAGLLHNVFKSKEGKLVYTEDKTGVKLTGVLGLRNNLEKNLFNGLDYLDSEEGFKVFLFHTTIEEIKPKDMDMVEGQSIDMLPKSFDYYAGGHVHYIYTQKLNNGVLAYPGPLFPNNFKELEEIKKGGFYIVDDTLNIERIDLNLKEVSNYEFDVSGKTVDEVEENVLEAITDFKDKIILIRIFGNLRIGKPSDLNLNRFNEYFKESFSLLINTNKLKSAEFKEQDLKESFEEIEKEVIGGIEKSERADVLLAVLDGEKNEAEKSADFENRLFKDFIQNLNLNKLFEDEIK